MPGPAWLGACGGRGATRYFPREAAILAKLEQVPTKTDFENFKTEIRQETMVQISQSVDPLRDEMRELTDRVMRIEASSSSGTSGKRQLALLSSMDVSNRRIAFIGFDGDDLNQRRVDINRFVGSLANAPRGTVGHFFAGPRNSQKVTRASYLEFASPHDAGQFLDIAKLQRFVLQPSGKVILVKPAKSQVNSARDWALRKAAEILKSETGQDAKIEWQSRAVKVGENVAFEQGAGDLQGFFKHPFSRLSLPL